MIDHAYITNLLGHVTLVQKFFAHLNNYKNFKAGDKPWYDAADAVLKYSRKIGCNPSWFI